MRRRSVLVGGCALLVGAIVASFAVGSNPLTPVEVWHGLVRHDGSEAASIVWDLRMPRTLLGLVVGSALAAAGVLLQALTRNPLAEPRILGISAGAALGVVVAITLLDIGTLAGYVWFGIAGALGAGLLVFGIAARTAVASLGDKSTVSATASPVTLTLIGAALDASLGAVTAGLLSADASTFEEYRFWVVGGLTGRGVSTAGQVVPFLAVGLVLAAVVARGLDALALGDDVARGLGVRVGLTRIGGGTAAVLLTGAGVAAAGPIAFVGLAVPHLVRALVGSDQRWVLGMSVLIGPALLLTADVVGRLITAGEVSAGIVMALLGAPLLAVLVNRARTVSA